MTETAIREIRFRPHRIVSAELLRYPEALPVFVVGSVRSGTSAVMDALREGAGIPGFNEGVFAQLLPTMLAPIESHYSTFVQKQTTMLGSVQKEFLTTGVKNLFGKAFIETMGPGRWLDKTPGGAAMISACPALLEIFPNAKFIFCKRRGIENVLSRQSKFPDQHFETHCRGWATTMEAWLDVEPRLGGHAIAIDQQDMAVEPELVSERVAAFLELAVEQRQGVLNRLQTKRLQQTRPAQDDVPIALRDTGWSEPDQATFRRLCGPMMEAFGYRLEQAASAKPAAYQFFVPIADGIVQRENVPTRRACRAVDATRFKIDPNPIGKPPAGIRHRMIAMDRFRQFSAQLRCIGKGAREGGGLVFSFVLERSSDRSRIFSAERTVAFGPPSVWHCELPQLAGPYDAVLSVRPVSDAAPAPSALWMDAQLS